MKQRIGTIGYRISQTISDMPKTYIDIVKWYPNPYYKKEAYYEKTEEGNYVDRTYNTPVYISPGCFINAENCYSLAIIDLSDEPNVRSVGLRPWELEPQEREWYDKIVKEAYDYAIKLYHKDM